MIQAGEMRWNIIVRRKVTIQDGYGDAKPIYTDTFYLKCKKEDGSGSKGVNGEEVFNSKNLTFTTYYRAITEDMLILFENKYYVIDLISVIGFKEGLKINAHLANE